MHSGWTLVSPLRGGIPLTAAIASGDAVTNGPSQSLTHLGKLVISTRRTNRSPGGLATSMQYGITNPGVDH